MWRIILVAWGLVATGLASAQTPYEKAVAAYRAGDHEQLIAVARDAIEQDPASPTYAYLLAVGLALAGNADDALDTLHGVADRGVSLGVEREPGLASLHEDARFAELVERFAALRAPRGEADIVRQHDVGDFIPEGLVLLSDGTMLMGSVRHQRIDRVTADGQISRFADAESAGLMSVFGMRADPDANRLYVATSGMAEAAELGEGLEGRAAIVVLDLGSGQVLDRFAAPGDEARVLGDLVVTDDHVFTTDSLGEVLCLDVGTRRWYTLVSRGKLRSPQGLVLDPTGRYLFVADYVSGIYRIDIRKHQGIRLPVPDNVAVHGIDGLYLHGERTLIATRNGFQPHAVLRLDLNAEMDRIASGSTLVSGLPEFDDPTLGQIVGSDFYFFANSHWPSFDAEKNLPPADQLSPPVVMRVSLDD